ncbi:hypothetical protein JYG36_13365 [Pseudomonas sp. SORT22]|uniref:Ig-like domain-containing protein n=1 Tax=Pseudomonas sp. SORT22 TaxID=2813842 RepID=UPI001BCE0CC3|nr:hypothetical protein [Pseudomonas sp. SORT22]QVM94115.1 hypothetical protein JYG36_13365 [Pseudomonas sp. SORT22]
MRQGVVTQQLLPAPVVLEAVGNNLVDTLERATVQIPVYAQMAANQLVRMIWDGRRENNQHYLHTEDRIVDADRVGEPIDFLVLAEHIAPLNKGLLMVRYRVFDFETDWHESDQLDLEVGRTDLVLSPPLVDEAKEGRLDPIGLTTATVRVVVYDGMLVGQRVYLECLRTGGGGSYLRDKEVTALTDLTFDLPVEFIIPTIGQNILFRYWVVEPGVRTRHSQLLSLWIRLQTLELQQPCVTQATAGQLDPLQALSGVNIKVGYPHMTVQENITLNWTGSAIGSTISEPLRGDPRGEVEFTLAPELVGANIGPSLRTVQVRYDVERVGGGAQRSPLLSLGIRPLAGLAQPAVAGVIGTTLDLDRVTDNPLVSIMRWSFAHAGQRVWLRCHGTKLNGDADVIELGSAAEVNEGEAANGLSRAIARNRLVLLRDNSELRVEFKVSFARTQQEADAVTFPLLRLTLRTGLSIAPELLVLNGPAVRVTKNWQQTRDFSGNTSQRQPTGGQPPYTYVAGNPEIAAVDQQGKVTGMGNGTTTITVRDANQRSVAYTVQVSNIRWLNVDELSTSYATGLQLMQSRGGSPVQASDEALLLGHYAQPFPSLMRRYFFMFTNGQCPGAERVYEVGSANTFRCNSRSINAGGWFLTSTRPAD